MEAVYFLADALAWTFFTMAGLVVLFFLLQKGEKDKEYQIGCAVATHILLTIIIVVAYGGILLCVGITELSRFQVFQATLLDVMDWWGYLVLRLAGGWGIIILLVGITAILRWRIEPALQRSKKKKVMT